MKSFPKLAWIILLFANASAVAQTQLQQGYWRGIFTLAEGREAPFNFELKGSQIWLINGSERFELKDIVQHGDSLFIPIAIYDALLVAKVNSDQSLSGIFKRLNTATPDAGIPFKVEHGKKYRFFEKQPIAGVSLDGKWDLVINSANGENKTVGVFEQKGSKLTGTILSITGDYRYFEGSVSGDAFFLSAFSGSNPSLIEGKIIGNDLTAKFTNFRGTQTIKGVRNAQAALPDAYTLTSLKEGAEFGFTFPDAFTGKPVSLNDPKYQGKAVIVTILGSWCPNCVDEAAFLAPWYKENRDRGVEIIGLAFERKNEPAFAKTRLEVLRNLYGIEYDLLFAGLADKKFASSVLPALSDVLSFPTTIYIDRNGKVAKIHTGYTGPATGAYYEAFVREFNRDVDELLDVPVTSGN